LAGAVFVSLAIHGLYFAVQTLPCHLLEGWPCVELSYVLALLNAGRPGEVPLAELSANLSTFRWEILSYLVVSAGLGIWVGKKFGDALIAGHLRFLARHPWALDLPLHSKYGHTYAYVMTRVGHEGRYLVYQGRLEEFGLLANGQFSYIVLTEVHRTYMRLRTSTSVVDPVPHPIGTKRDIAGAHQRKKSRFVIEGPDIANAIFDSYEVKVGPGDFFDLQRLLEAAELSQGDILQFYVEEGILPSPPAEPSGR
jgi:hypothetical protein